MLLSALYAVSMNNNKKGVVVYAFSNRYAKMLFRSCIDILTAYIPIERLEVYKHKLTIVLPNKKTIQFKSVEQNTRENRKGIKWEEYDEFSDHYKR